VLAAAALLAGPPLAHGLLNLEEAWAMASWAAVVMCSLGAAWCQSNCRLYIVGQYDWGRKVGFYLDVEGARLAELPVILGLADGQQWRFAAHRPVFAHDRPYSLRAVVSPQGGELFVDERRVAESPGGFVPARGAALEVNHRPAWCHEPGDWVAVVERVTVLVQNPGGGEQRREFDFSDFARRPLPLVLFQPDAPAFAELEIPPGATVTIEARLRFAPSDPRSWAPLLDAYGQCRYAEWPEKVHSDAQLQADVAREEEILATMPASPDFDEYGGYLRAGWRGEARGFFYVTRRADKWWLVTPAGNPCFYLGVCAVPGLTWETTPVTEREFLYEWLPPRADPWAAAWSKNCWGLNDETEYVCFYTCNLIRKYGPQWAERATALAVRRLKSWGFSGGGKWGAPAELVQVPVLRRSGVPILVRHPDVFDRQVQAALRASLERQVGPQRNNPRILGWSLGNEYDEIVTRRETLDILQRPATTPAKQALLDYALEELYQGALAKLAQAWQTPAASRSALYAATDLKPPAQDLDKLRRFYAERYYEFLYRTIKELDPNHLYLGFWIVPGWWEEEEDWRLIARHCDVIGYDRYSRTYPSALLARLQRETDKPTLCGEFSMPAWYAGQRGFGRYEASWARDDAEAGDLYRSWVRAAAEDPYCVGLIWFLWRDQPLTGRGPGRGPALVWGEHYAFGLITETDRPKWELVRRLREANLAAPRWRLGLAR
jgi:hypothetical protein